MKDMIATIILLVMMMVGLGIAIGRHGEDQGEYNAWATLLSAIIQLVLFYYAGLFDKFFN